MPYIHSKPTATTTCRSASRGSRGQILPSNELSGAALTLRAHIESVRDELVIRQRYQFVSIVKALLIGTWFISSSMCFFYASLAYAGTWLFVLGSIKMLIRPTIRFTCRVYLKRFPHDVLAALEETGMPAGNLTLEITESVVMDDAPLTARVMSELKALGVKISIDDFGTGYSSLSYLKRFPADYLKIDRSFVAGLMEVAGDRMLVEGIVGLAHTLGLKVVAEGIETAEQLEWLRETGCELGQGYYFSRPLIRRCSSAHPWQSEPRRWAPRPARSTGGWTASRRKGWRACSKPRRPSARGCRLLSGASS